MTEPVRMSLSNLSVDPIKTVIAWANPEKWSATIQVQWARHVIPGLSHQPKHYVSTANAVIPLEMFHATHQAGDKTSLQEFERWYESLAYPLENGSMPIVLFRWPRLAAVPCTVNTVTTSFEMFAADGAPRLMNVSLELETINSGAPQTYESVQATGWVRAGTSSTRRDFLNGVPR